LIFQTFF